jgi:hypothetical protein
VVATISSAKEKDTKVNAQKKATLIKEQKFISLLQWVFQPHFHFVIYIGFLPKISPFSKKIPPIRSIIRIARQARGKKFHYC